MAGFTLTKEVFFMLDTKESRRAVVLALAARELHAYPEIEGAEKYQEFILKLKKEYHKKRTSWDKQRLNGVEYTSASKLIYPNRTTRGINYETTRHPNPPPGRGGKAPRTKAYRGKSFMQVVTHVNPVETGVDFWSGDDPYFYSKYRQSMRNVANADKILGSNGYGYSTGCAVPHILAKICAYMEEDKKDWMWDGGTREFDRKVLAELDAKAMRVYGKTQFAGNSQYEYISQEADYIQGFDREFNPPYKEYRTRLLEAVREGKKGVRDELDAHDERVKHYKALDRAIRSGREYEMSEKLKYHRELDRYKTDIARGRKPGDTVDMGKKWRRKDNGEYEVTDEPDLRIMGERPKVPRKKRKGYNVSLKRRFRNPGIEMFVGVDDWGDAPRWDAAPYLF